MTNIVMISIDDLFSLSAWEGYRDLVKTPHLDDFAAQSNNFTQAFAEVALCNPSRSATLSGQSPWTTGIIDNSTSLFDVVAAEDTLFGQLRTAGYDIAMGGKVFHTLNDPALSAITDVELDDAGFRNGTVPDGGEVERVAYGPSGDLVLADDVLTASASAFLAQSHDDPFVLAAGLYRPHADWIVPQAFYDLYDPADIAVPYFATSADAADFYYALTGDDFHQEVLAQDVWVDLIHGYLASVSYADALFGQMIAAVDASPGAADTHVVMWSDHGYHLGDRGVWGKFTLWEQSGRAPLMIRTAGQTEGRQIDTAVSLGDIFPTVMDLAGVTPAAVPSGDSLLPLMSDDPTGFAGTGALTWMYGGISYRSDHYRYIREEDGTERLFHIESDPNQLTNLIDDPAHATIAATHRAAIQDAAPGFDLHFGSAGDDTLLGGQGQDIFILGPGADAARGKGGDDVYIALGTVDIDERYLGGTDTLIVAGDASLPAHVENLRLRVFADGATLRGNALGNLLTASENGDTLFGFAGDDTLDSRIGADVLFGGDGDDLIHASGGADSAYGGGGNDTILTALDPDLAYGGAGDDTLFGGAGTDTLFGGTGNDVIDAGAGSFDLAYGGAGDDDIYIGFGGPSTAWGGGGADHLTAGPVGTATLLGGDNDDVILSSGAALIAYGGSGDDDITGANKIDLILGGAGNDTIDGLRGADMLFGQAGNDTIYGSENYSGEVTVNGGTGDDVLFGGGAVLTRLIGGSGDDLLSARGGTSALFGGAGADRLIAGTDLTRMVGGADADSFVIDAGFADDARINDFQAGIDTLAIDPSFALAGETAAAAVTRQASELTDRVILELPTGQVVILDVTLAALLPDVTFL